MQPALHKKPYPSVRCTLLLLLFVIAAATHCRETTGASTPAAVKGVLDLREYNPRTSPAIPLNGEWKFFWKRLLPGADSVSPAVASDGYFNMPGSWNGRRVKGQELDGNGYATLTLTVRMRESGLFALKLMDAQSAYELYVNGKETARNGRTGASASEMKPRWLPLIVSLPLRAGDNFLLLRLSNYHHRKGGMGHAIHLGTPETVHAMRGRALTRNFFLFGGFVVIALFNLALYFLRRREYALLYFGAFSILIGVRTMFTGEKYALHLMPDFDWAWAVRVEYLSYYLALPMFSSYVQKVFPREYSARFSAFVWILTALFAASVVFLSPRIFSFGIGAFQILTLVVGAYTTAALVRAVLNKRTGARLFTLGLLLLLFTAVNDILYNQDLIQGGLVSHIGVFAFVWLQVFVLSKRFELARSTIEGLSGRLEELVRRRLGKLESSRAELAALNNFLKDANASSRLEEMLNKTFRYMEANFNIEGTMVQLVDRDKNELYYYKTDIQSFYTPEMTSYIREMRIPLKRGGGIGYIVARRKRRVYLPRIAPEQLAPDDPLKKLVRLVGIRSALIFPLIVENKLLGLIYFSNYSRRMKLGPAQIESIGRFCEQIAGSIHVSLLSEEVIEEQSRSDRLLLNILPRDVAEELKETGKVQPVLHDSVTILFCNIMGFEVQSLRSGGPEVLQDLNSIFLRFDRICEKYEIEKIKTFGNYYMAAGGVPVAGATHPLDACLAALEMLAFMNTMNELERERGNANFWNIRIGMHTGSVVAGVIGRDRFSYDLWGDAVNIAARAESTGVTARINISHNLHHLIKDLFACSLRGTVHMKNRGDMEMYFLDRIQPRYSEDEDGVMPNVDYHVARSRYVIPAGEEAR